MGMTEEDGDNAEKAVDERISGVDIWPWKLIAKDIINAIYC